MRAIIQPGLVAQSERHERPWSAEPPTLPTCKGKGEFAGRDRGLTVRFRIRPRRLRGLLLRLGLAAAATISQAASVDFDIQPRALQVGEAAVCTITVRSVDNPAVPSLPNIQGFTTSYIGTERSFSFTQGRSDSSITFRFQMLPLQSGEFTIGPFQYATGGETFDLAPVTLRVVAAGSSPQDGSSGRQDVSELLFAAITASATNLFVQQPFDLVLSIYSRGVNLGREIGLNNLPTTGLDVQNFEEIQGSREVVNNMVYDVRRFRARAQTLTSGTFHLEPSLRVQILVQRDRRRSASPFDGLFDDSFFPDDLFFGRVQAHPLDLSVPGLDIAVRPVPTEGQPPGYGGAVGRFAFEANVRPSEVQAGDPVTLSLQISGEGNLGNVTPPTLAGGEDVRVYEPKLVNRDVSDSRSTGRVLYEQVIIPRSEKVQQFPALTFSYLDPSSGRYESITKGPFPIKVRPGNSAGRVVAATGAPAEPRPAILGTDIVYLKSPPRRWTRAGQTRWLSPPLEVAVHSLPAWALLGAWIFARRRERILKDVAFSRRLRAPRSARPALRQAEKALATGQVAAFYEALWQAIAAYFGNRLNLSPGAVTRDIVAERLRTSGFDANRLAQLESLLAQCDEARYGHHEAASSPVTEEQAYYERLRDLLKACEKVRL
mgnify:CR=1 FL=1